MDAGGDWIRSSNLGDHETSRISAFGEWRHDLAPDVQVDASLRLDRYSEFGTAWSPSVGAGWRLARAVRVRASIARAFRVPTFTERFYQDPANWARPEVDAETAWAGEAGADIAFADGWTATTTVFGRLEEDVIDWLRPTPDDRWRTYNIRNVDTVGIELGVARSFGDTAFFRVQYTGLDVRADAVTQLSKYVLDFAPHSLTGAAVLPLPWALRVAPRIEYKHRTRSSGRSEYTLLDVRVSRRVGLLTLFVEGANLFDQEYQEVSNVAMPGRSGIVGITVGAR
jgi:iron complex outermembrane receptor protein